jgi:hypothetical protein
MMIDAKRDLLRHFLATLAYRAGKVLLGAPQGFADFDAGHGVRKPIEIVSHISALLAHALSFLAPQQRIAGAPGTQVDPRTWDEEVQRFQVLLRELDQSLASGTELCGRTEEQLLQGPLADAMTHLGQLAMLRRMASSPIPKDDFDEATIHVGDVSFLF